MLKLSKKEIIELLVFLIIIAAAIIYNFKHKKAEK